METKTCSQLGMTVSDSNNENHQILCNAINEGIAIVFDNFYTVNVIQEIELTNSINITSQDKSYGMSVSSSQLQVFTFSEDIDTDAITSTENTENVVRFKKCKLMHRSSRIKTISGATTTITTGVNINIDGITVVNEESYSTYLIGLGENSVMNNISITNCIFRDKMAAIRFVGSLTADPATTDIGFNKFIFKNNEVYDNRTNFILLTDQKFSEVEISYNKIRNFDYVFANIGVTNEHDYQEEIPEYRLNAIVTHNEVICDDDWWHDTAATTTYATFLLIENNKLYYAYNHVEGLKSEVNVSLYDLYASSMDVTSEHNVWKNNLVFDPECIYNVLMKAKGNGGIKRYYNNKYYAEESFVTSMGYTVDDLSLKLFDNESTATWEIVGNEIECCSLYNSTASTPTELLVFNDNIINVNTWSESSSLFYLRDNASLSAENNEITINNISTSFYLLNCPNGKTLNEITLNNNTFNIESTLASRQYLCYGLENKKTTMQGNTFNIEAANNVAFTYLCNYGEANFTGNVINSNKYVHLLPCEITDLQIYEFELNTDSTEGTFSYDIVYYDLLENKADGFNKKYYMDFIIDDTTTCSTEFTLKVVDGVAKISFVPEGETTAVEYQLYNGQGNNTRLSLSDDTIGELIFDNTEDYGSILFRQNEDLGECKINISIRTK